MSAIKLEKLLSEAKLPEDIFEVEGTYIQAVREGISGSILKPTINALDLRELFVLLLNTDKSNLNKFYKYEHLSSQVSEAILDTLSVYKLAFRVYRGNDTKVFKWLKTKIPALSNQVPMDLLDTFRGRKLVKDCLMVMEDGDFT